MIKALGIMLLCSPGKSYISPINRRFISMKKTGIRVPATILYKPKTPNQKTYVNCLKSSDNKIIFAVGPAGTGKTLFACTQAIQDFKSGLVEKIVITRPTVTVDEDLGFLPGDINEKMKPWSRPIFDIFLEHYLQRDIDELIQLGKIEISPLAYMRGRTFKKCFIIADEMQNSTPNQMLMLATRLGTESRMVVTGDLNQSDKGCDSGLSDFINKFTSYRKKNTDDCGIQIIELDHADIERNPIVAKILEIYSPKPKAKTKIIRKSKEKTDPVVIPNDDAASLTSYDLFLADASVVHNNDAALMPISHISSKFDY